MLILFQYNGPPQEIQAAFGVLLPIVERAAQVGIPSKFIFSE